jgi:hypothetical protein
VSTLRGRANEEAFDRMAAARTFLVDVAPALDVVPGMTPNTVLTSGAPLPWDGYARGQRRALVGGALFEGLAVTEDEAVEGFASGSIRIGTCHEHDCVGSVAGIYTASMPVFVVENRTAGNRAFCNFYEGPSRFRLNYGVYNQEVHDALVYLNEVIGPTMRDALEVVGEIDLSQIIRRALHMGDELHSRNTAATLLFIRELFPGLLELYPAHRQDIDRTLAFIRESDYFFLRLSMASAKATANAARGVDGSSLVTSMMLDCAGFSIGVSGLDDLFRGPDAVVEAKLFEGFTPEDIEWVGGESCHNEVVGLGGFAQAAAFGLQAYQGGSAQAMVDLNRSMYDITVGEHPEFGIPFFGFRGVPLGIDVFRVIDTGITPCIDGGLAGKDGGQIGAGIVRAPIECFLAAAEAFRNAFGQDAG